MELEKLNRRTRKLVYLQKAVNPNSDIEWLYIPRKEGDRRLMRAEFSLLAIRGFENYLKISYGVLLTAAHKMDGDFEVRNVERVPVLEKYYKEKWHYKLTEEKLHSQFLQQTETIGGNESWLWVKDGEKHWKNHI